MTVDEALAIAETVLNGECLNDVQELIFRQCWSGRCSYEEIAKLSKYDDEYLTLPTLKGWGFLHHRATLLKHRFQT